MATLPFAPNGRYWPKSHEVDHEKDVGANVGDRGKLSARMAARGTGPGVQQLSAGAQRVFRPLDHGLHRLPVRQLSRGRRQSLGDQLRLRSDLASPVGLRGLVTDLRWGQHSPRHILSRHVPTRTGPWRCRRSGNRAPSPAGGPLHTAASGRGPNSGDSIGAGTGAGHALCPADGGGAADRPGGALCPLPLPGTGLRTLHAMRQLRTGVWCPGRDVCAVRPVRWPRDRSAERRLRPVRASARPGLRLRTLVIHVPHLGRAGLLDCCGCGVAGGFGLVVVGITCSTSSARASTLARI
jgi:hypothetical protein